MKKRSFSLLLGLVPVIYSTLIYTNLPEQIPVHYGPSGVADRYGSKNQIFFMALMPLIILGAFYLVRKIDPKNRLSEMGTKFDQMALFLVLCLSGISTYFIYITSHQATLLATKWIFVLLGFLMIILANYLKTLRPNYFIGIKSPWAIENEEVWKATHRLAAHLMSVSGILVILLALISIPDETKFYILLCITLVSSVFPYFYSYYYFRNMKKD